MSPDPSEPPPHVAIQVFLDGIIAAVRSVFFYVLVGNYVGLGALAHEVGFSFWWMALSTMLIWAAPAQVIRVGILMDLKRPGRRMTWAFVRCWCAPPTS